MISTLTREVKTTGYLQFEGTRTGRWKSDRAKAFDFETTNFSREPKYQADDLFTPMYQREVMVGLKYVGCTFPGTAKEYTYHTELELKVGDKVKVQTAKGVATITVSSLGRSKPGFATKGIIEIIK